LADRYGASGTDERVQTAVLRPTLHAIDAPLRAPAPDAVGYAAPAVLTSFSKRCVDVIAGSILLVIFSPIWLLIAILIKLTSRGPIIFRQERVGAGGMPFTLLKFRTMRDGSPEQAHRDFVTRFILGDVTLAQHPEGVAYKLNGDARITAIGRILRKLSLDEVPQLVNVVRGQMSLVGPRPPLAYEVDHYEAWQLERLTARPGITGLWQVSGRNRLTHDEMCRLDIEYIRTWSMARDLEIVVKTPWVMLVDGGGAS
jgi:lipopolysaccharide/colanic/teichoic acid biosynthesis glycosyltransferase